MTQTERIPLSPNSTRSTIGHINSDHLREMLVLAHGLTDATWAQEARLKEIYTDALELTVTAKDRSESRFVDFEQAVKTGGQAHQAIKGLVQKARTNLQQP
ncbi:DUF2470 domain-containing protein [Deinococcus cellulosilyticus]|uniref:DUF2470 domain-containing protein n=1 Tax=Deinococcus cellulosilyticus (strain DSM 18568 / NBRC 106333 / KACC 11606 / 5516J-15) TaxID=1223518 RepID=A0A511N1Y0_DEIC1|nr:DUF2470 domain-containing protein [Deinococcus cellulosilyticus]GEM46386.1 hypothetical protein DC3_20210 [Deinococcus cellulosilyticus NBRC 106333 = KACC 11606]